MKKRKIEAMHEAYGMHPNLCKVCDHFRKCTTRAGRTYFKCEAYGDSASESTDWRANWTACGLFNQPLHPELHTPMIERLKRAERKEPEGPVEGQISLEELL